jgi:hypothetical protein
VYPFHRLRLPLAFVQPLRHFVHLLFLHGLEPIHYVIKMLAKSEYRTVFKAQAANSKFETNPKFEFSNALNIAQTDKPNWQSAMSLN